MCIDESGLLHGILPVKLLRSERPLALRLIETSQGERWSALHFE
jgi:hypothetical protein